MFAEVGDTGMLKGREDGSFAMKTLAIEAGTNETERDFIA